MTLVKGLGAGLVLAACMLCSRESFATVIFHNTGTTSGWAATLAEHNGSISQVTNIVYDGTTAVKAMQVYDPNYTGRYHSEFVVNDVYNRGETGFYGFAFRLQGDWQFTNQNYNIAQFIADFSNTGCDDWMPSTMVWLNGSNLNTRVKTGSICAQKTTTFNNVASVTAGVWHRYETQVSWQSGTNGYFKVWYDGNKVFERLNIATTVSDDRAFDFRVGLYANSWHDDGYMSGSQGTRQIWYDQIGVGTTYADADPDGW